MVFDTTSITSIFPLLEILNCLYIPWISFLTATFQPSTSSLTRQHFNMSDFTASVQETKNGFHVDGYEKISYDFTFLDGVFNPENPQLAECYKRWGRALAVTDMNVYNVYGDQIEKYFKHHNLELKVHKTKIGEKAKTIPTFLSIVDSMTEFGIYRKVLVVIFHCTFAMLNH